MGFILPTAPVLSTSGDIQIIPARKLTDVANVVRRS